MKMLIASLAMVGIGLGMLGTAGVLASETELSEQIISGESLNISEELPSFKNINIEGGLTDIEILEGDKFYIEATAKELEGTFRYKVENNTLFVEHENKDNNFNFLKMDKIIDVKIYVPKDTKLNEIETENGMGDMLVYGLDMERLDIEAGVGKITIEDVIADEFEFEGGVGDVTCKNITFYDTKIEAGMGAVELEGDFDGDIMIEGGMGDISITTTREYSDYNFKIEAGLGNISVNDNKYGLFEGDINENRGGKHMIDAEVGMGSIDIKTN